MYYLFLKKYLETIARNTLRQNIYDKFHEDEFTKNELYSFLDEENRIFLDTYYNNHCNQIRLGYCGMLFGLTGMFITMIAENICEKI